MRAAPIACSIAIASTLLVAACASNRVLMPPRIDLRGYGTVGMLDFTPQTFDGLNVQATREFLSVLHAAQPGIPVLELGDQQTVLRSAKRTTLDPEAIRAIGKRHNVDVLVVGELDSQRIEPSVAVGRSADFVTAGAALRGALTVRMYETRSGATIWSSSVQCQEPLAKVRLTGSDLSGLAAGDPAGAATRLVRQLVDGATTDFWPYWVRG